jgi:hypothetical protein
MDDNLIGPMAHVEKVRQGAKDADLKEEGRVELPLSDWNKLFIHMLSSLCPVRSDVHSTIVSLLQQHVGSACLEHHALVAARSGGLQCSMLPPPQSIVMPVIGQLATRPTHIAHPTAPFSTLQLDFLAHRAACGTCRAAA